MANNNGESVDLPKDVIDNLYSGENVLYCVKKQFGLEMKPSFLIISDRRVIYYDQKILGRYDLTDIPYPKLECVYFEEGLVASQFALKDEDSHIISLNWIKKDECKDVIIAIRDAINEIAIEPVSIQKKKKVVGESWYLKKPKEMITRTMPMTRVVEHTVAAPVKDDPIEKLNKLQELKEMGLLSDEEFEEKRKALISEI